MPNLLTMTVFAPLAGLLAVVLLPKERDRAIRAVSAGAMLVTLVLSVFVLLATKGQAGYVLEEKAPWISAGPLTVEYYLGVDGVSGILIFLTALLGFLAVFASNGIRTGVKGYFAMYLLLQTGILGVFAALDMFLFYVFWEVMLLPMYFLIGIWGGPRRAYAAIKFFLYTLVGSLLLLAGMIVLYLDAGTLSIPALVAAKPLLGSFALAQVVFVAMFIAFAIKVPLFPFHTWLPDAHVEAPTPISVILAGILLKTGAYGLIRIAYPMLPDAAKSLGTVIAVFGVINIVYGAFVAMGQRDLKRLIAYSSVSHMGFVVLGLAALQEESVRGAVLQMFNHGTISAMLFLIAGVVYDRAHHREYERFGGLAQNMPKYAVITSLAFFASLGLPGLSGFIGEALVFLGSYKTFAVPTLLSLVGVVITAAYYLRALQLMFFGRQNPEYAALPDANRVEMFTLVPLAAVTVFLGVYPHAALVFFDESVKGFLRLMGAVG